MIWKLWQLRTEMHDMSQRSEEVSDIIERMPSTFGKRVAVAVVVFAFLLFFFGWIIRYPDVVSGNIKINSNTAAVKLVANSSGKLQIRSLNPQAYVDEDELIAVIENPAKTEDVIFVEHLLTDMNPNDPLKYTYCKDKFPEKVALGELNVKYYAFLLALKNSCSYLEEGLFKLHAKGLIEELRWKKEMLKETNHTLKSTLENLQITEKWFDKYASLNNVMVATSEFEVDKSKVEYLSVQIREQNLKREIASMQMQIVEATHKLSLLEIEKREKEKTLYMDLLVSYHELVDNIKAWKLKYVLKSPIKGKVEYLNFWTNEQYVPVGEELFSIIPQANIVIGQMYLPAIGAGKVKEGSRVSIKLKDYPYMEYGSILGMVKSISLVPQLYLEGTSKIDMYLVTVEIPGGLVTNYGEQLPFKYELSGIADIIVKERRLIERLFDNLRSKTIR